MPLDITALTNWLSEYDPANLHSEDDVETKFVQPLFCLLGYPDTHRRGKYPITLHTGRKGRRHEVDQIYFASANAHEQKLGSVLVIVEAKRSDISKIDEAIAQAQSYGEHLRPLLLVVTNGTRLVILRRRRFDADEEIINHSLDKLRTIKGAQELIDLVAFETVLHQHEQLTDELSHQQFVALEQALRAHPDIQTLLAQGDFAETVARDGQSLRVTRAKVQIEGVLPLCLGGGSCDITFSHISRRGLRIQLDHAEILRSLMIGVGSNPAWDTRHFIERQSEDRYLVRLGAVETQVSEREAQDLCACIDLFAGSYRDAMMQAEDILQSWTFPLIIYEGDPAFYLTSFHASLLKPLQKFIDQHDWQRAEGDPAWRVFEFWSPGFQIGHRDGIHALIALTQHLTLATLSSASLRHLLYVLPDGRPLPDLTISPEEWEQNVGQRGQWTVQQTYQWLSEQLIPEVERRHWSQSSTRKRRIPIGQSREKQNSQFYRSHELIQTSDLVPYIEDIQRWLTTNPVRMIQTDVIKGTYSQLLDLARRANPSQLGLHYVTSNMVSVTPEVERPVDGSPAEHLADFFQRGERLARYLDQSPTIPLHLCDHVMRSFYALYRDARIDASQRQLHRLWKVVKPLWQLAQFELRHVWPRLESQK